MEKWQKILEKSGTLSVWKSGNPTLSIASSVRIKMHRALKNTQLCNHGINANFVFSSICALHDVSKCEFLCQSVEYKLYLKVAHFIGLVNLDWHSQDKVGNIDILTLWRICEEL